MSIRKSGAGPRRQARLDRLDRPAASQTGVCYRVLPYVLFVVIVVVGRRKVQPPLNVFFHKLIFLYEA
jgi:hypothetical protein